MYKKVISALLGLMGCAAPAEETDAWYCFHGDTNMVLPDFPGGYSLPDGRTVLYYDWSDDLRVVTLYLTKTGEWHVLSQLPLSPVAPVPGPAYA